MKICVLDYSGHPFQAQLSKSLAQRPGNTVLHLYSADIETPRGDLTVAPPLRDHLQICGVSTGKPINKYNLFSRFWGERHVLSLLMAQLAAFGPDIVVSGNAPPQIQYGLQKFCKRRGIGFVYWLQDIYHLAYRDTRKGGVATAAIGAVIRHVELAAMRRADHVITISEDFRQIIEPLGVDAGRISVIHNWASPDELLPQPKDNDFARRVGIDQTFNFVYSGTLGLKHNPGYLSGMAAHFRDCRDVRIVVVSNGLGRKFLDEEKARLGLDNLVLLDFVPYDELPMVMGAADVLVTLLEQFAGAMSVPSKVLSYICAGKPILGSIPRQNLASRIIADGPLGVSVEPREGRDAFLAEAERLYRQPELRASCAANCGIYARDNFDLERITQRFETVIAKVRGQ